MAGTNRELRSMETSIVSTRANGAAGPAESAAEDHELTRAVEYVLADCFLAVGQTIGMRRTVDYEAVVWWHDHFRSRFLAALRRRGNRWAQDRDSVTAVGWMLAERAVRYADGQGSIDVETARLAAADVERYCQHRSRRAARKESGGTGDDTRLAGYWCVPWPC